MPIAHDAALQTAVSFMHSGGPISKEYAIHFIRRIEHSTRKDIGYLPAFQRRVLETFEGWVGIVWSAVSGCRWFFDPGYNPAIGYPESPDVGIHSQAQLNLSWRRDHAGWTRGLAASSGIFYRFTSRKIYAQDRWILTDHQIRWLSFIWCK